MLECPPCSLIRRAHFRQYVASLKPTRAQDLPGVSETLTVPTVLPWPLHSLTEWKRTTLSMDRLSAAESQFLGRDLAGSLARATPLRDKGAAGLLSLLLALGVQADARKFRASAEARRQLASEWFSGHLSVSFAITP